MNLEPASYFFKKETFPFVSLNSIGWSLVDSEEYSFDGEMRPDSGHAIFQYTLKGEGRIALDGAVHKLPAGRAFLVKVPSLHRYYYDARTGAPWEFIWFNMKGKDAHMYWDRILEVMPTPILQLDADSVPIQLFWKLYASIQTEELRDVQTLSSSMYQWIVSMIMFTHYPNTSTDDQHHLVNETKAYIKDHLKQYFSLEELAEHVGVSKYHLCRLFTKYEHVSPMEYTKRRRIELAVSELRQTDRPIHQIAQDLCFESPSFFGKTFRSYMGMNPREYRKRVLEFPATVFL